MIVVCIDNGDIDGSNMSRCCLELGESYTVIGENSSYYNILINGKESNGWLKERFVDVTEYRNTKLNRIL
jgi:hypothetical protein